MKKRKYNITTESEKKHMIDGHRQGYLDDTPCFYLEEIPFDLVEKDLECISHPQQ